MRIAPGFERLEVVTMRAYLGDPAQTVLHCAQDPGGRLLTVGFPSGIELSLSDAYDGVGPLALRHYLDG